MAMTFTGMWYHCGFPSDFPTFPRSRFWSRHHLVPLSSFLYIGSFYSIPFHACAQSLFIFFLFLFRSFHLFVIFTRFFLWIISWFFISEQSTCCATKVDLLILKAVAPGFDESKGVSKFAYSAKYLLLSEDMEHYNSCLCSSGGHLMKCMFAMQ